MKKMQKVLCMVTALLMGSGNVLAATWEKPVPNDCSLVNGEKFYLYNASVDGFATTGDIQVWLAEEGVAIQFRQEPNGDWTLESESGYWYSDLDYVGCNGGAGEDNSRWCIERHDVSK